MGLEVGTAVGSDDGAKVGAIASKEHPKRIDETARYLSQAVSFLDTDPPCLIAVGGTLATACLALQRGLACHLAGGNHHAHPDFGSGFCIFNDLAVGSIYALNKGFFKKIAIIDLDVHKGDGTAEICSKFDKIITYSVHSEKNMAFGKKPSNFDLSLPSNVTQDEYIGTVLNILDSLDEDIELILYNAGADCYKNDLIGKMNLEKRTLKKRDQVVYDFCFSTSKNIITVLGGGYAKNIKDTVDIYYNTFTESFNLWKKYRG
mgnify:CR=1 FL=1